MVRKHRILRPGKGLVPAEYTVDRETASAALASPERTVVLPDTPLVGDPRAVPKLPRSRVEIPSTPAPVEPTRLLDPGTIGLPRTREPRAPVVRPGHEPDAAALQATPTADERIAAWFAALLPSEAHATDASPTIVEVRDGDGAPVEAAPTIDTVEEALRGRGTRRSAKRFTGLKVVLEHDDGRRIHVNIE